MKPFLLLGIIVFLSLSGCKKNDEELHGTITQKKGTLRNITLGGCEWFIQLDVKDEHGRDILEPVNIEEFTDLKKERA